MDMDTFKRTQHFLDTCFEGAHLMKGQFTSNLKFNVLTYCDVSENIKVVLAEALPLPYQQKLIS